MAYAQSAAIIATPIGIIRVEADEIRVTGIRIDKGGEATGPANKLLSDAVAQLRAYFAADLTTFDLPLAEPRTARGAALRSAICAIAYGETRSYGELATQSGSSARAVGQACARNPFPIIVPCHRVLGTNGVLGPYSAGNGSTTKSWLLKHEKVEGWLL
jgi:methylated-DNA-[protein]-cysteine S-methyltransferase